MLAFESRIEARACQHRLLSMMPDKRREYLEAERKRNLADLLTAKREMLAKMKPEVLPKLVLACPAAIMAL